MNWQPISTAPKDNNRPLYLARFNEDEKLQELDFDGGWEYWQESDELAHINGFAWVSNGGIEEPTHWAYQDIGAPPGGSVNLGLDENQITAAFQIAARKAVPPMAFGHVSECWFRRGVAAAEADSKYLVARVAALETQVAHLVSDIATAVQLLSLGDRSDALVQIRAMQMRASPSYLEALTTKTNIKLPATST